MVAKIMCYLFGHRWTKHGKLVFDMPRIGDRYIAHRCVRCEEVEARHKYNLYENGGMRDWNKFYNELETETDKHQRDE